MIHAIIELQRNAQASATPKSIYTHSESSFNRPFTSTHHTTIFEQTLYLQISKSHPLKCVFFQQKMWPGTTPRF